MSFSTLLLFRGDYIQGNGTCESPRVENFSIIWANEKDPIPRTKNVANKLGSEDFVFTPESLMGFFRLRANPTLFATHSVEQGILECEGCLTIIISQGVVLMSLS